MSIIIKALLIAILYFFKDNTILFLTISAVFIIFELINQEVRSKIFKKLAQESERFIKGKSINFDKHTNKMLLFFDNSVSNIVAALKKVTNHFKELVSKLQITSDIISSGSKQIDYNVNIAKETSEEILISIRQISAGAEDGADSAQKIVSNTKDIVNKASEVKEKSRLTLKRTVDFKDYVNKVVNAFDKFNYSMMQTYDQSEESVKVISELEKNIAKIQDFVQIVGDIAEQINLLSLNAAIEAARAGEHGKGFAVVAEEIRKLATQSSNAVEGISDMAKEINAKTTKTILGIEDAFEKIKLNIEQLKEVSEMFEQTKNAIDEINQDANSITVLSDEQSSGVLNIQEEMETLSAAIEEISAATQQITASIQQHDLSLVELLNEVKNLKNNSNELNDFLKKFVSLDIDKGELDKRIKKGKEIIKSIATLSEIVSMDKDKHKIKISEIMSKQELFGDFITLDKNGNVLYTYLDTNIKSFAYRPWFRESIKGKIYETDVFISAIIKKPIMIISAPIVNDKGDIVGVIAGNLKLD